jgi:serine protease
MGARRRTRSLGRLTAALVIALASLLAAAASAAAKPILMPTVLQEIAKQKAVDQAHLYAPLGPIQLPAPPCPENGLLPAPFSNCGLPELPATTLPWPGNMSYWGGHVQTNPKVYIVYWGWGEPGAFPAGQTCVPESFAEGSVTATLNCDPDGAGKRMADFVAQLGATAWAGTSSQYYQTDSAGNKQFIGNPSNQLGGIWVDDTNNASGLPKTSSTNPAGPTNTYTDLAQEAARAVQYFGITDLANADIVIAQPPNFSDPNAVSTGYCAFHDYTQPALENGIYNAVQPGIAFTNMPYALAINSNGQNVCGKDAVNSGSAGTLDGFTIVLGHEIEETVTDPGAEDIQGGSGLNNQTYLGGWYDPLDANENGDKCAWVGESLLTATGPPAPIFGAMGTMIGNQGETFPVQSLWSNSSALGAGYCAGAGTDLPTG